ncbi:hypothetical protein DVK00_02980 [Haloarcula sp. Atlit-47R]|uniref:hypothetical protein n=1 Tax=Haloarcula sp. Atlit-47R TaxID=2282132 RepID=UPI000EF288D5|nr:hypothetical protein [Haloarcula sp. Atlit-47R]RLM47488.1 hypothetical protein DVK00_02980 [Haloarcula sp. Atlit-47R]
MPESTQVNVKLPLKMKRDWEDYIEESDEATSLSHLIRLSVQREISDENRGPTIDGLDLDDATIDVDIDGVHDRLDEMQDVLDEVRSTVSSMESGQIADPEQIEAITERMYDTMPRRSLDPLGGGVEMQPHEVAQELLESARQTMEGQGWGIDDMAERQNFDYGLLSVYKAHYSVGNYEIEQAIERVQQYSERIHVVRDFEHTIIFEAE